MKPLLFMAMLFAWGGFATSSSGETWTLKNGEVVEGDRVEDYDQVFIVRDDSGRRRTIARSQLADSEASPPANEVANRDVPAGVRLPPLHPQVGLLLRRLHDRHQRLDVLRSAGSIGDATYHEMRAQQVKVFVNRVRAIHPEISAKDLLAGLASLTQQDLAQP